MSLPLTRRIARAALLIAAGAAPVVGAAGSASAVDLQGASPLGAVAAPDTDGLTSTLVGASGKAANTGGDTVKKAGKSVGKAGKTTTPVAQKATGDATGNAGAVLGGATQTVGGGNLPTGEVPGGDLTAGLANSPLG
ncbi:ATP-binding protein [Streptomyces sp. NBC_01142]|uniref:ATP-binding protein n=1 Tax=Streptomyces sp. NBC_01142 TaxID=2975865 RepID=UPI0022532C6A|nr:ATP-binding protein [Streptomyces sp. NBC_01142]MCX4819187.1 ATP-binding protein [Streptomyces sp. NBC_01142]